MFKEDITRIKKCEIRPITLGDHAPITLTITLENENGRTLWRLNNSLLQDDFLKDKIKQIIEVYFQNNDKKDITPVILWEAAKVIIRGELISLTSWKNKTYIQEINVVKGEIEERDHEQTGNDQTKKKLTEKLNELNVMLTKEIEKSLAFTKQPYYDNSPRALKLLAFK